MSLRSAAALAAAILLATATVGSNADTARAQETPDKHPCGIGFVEHRPLLKRVAFQRTDADQPTVGLTFVGHATFLVASPQGITVATDYNDHYRAERAPDIATMNIQRGNHSTYNVEPSVKHVLRGWDEGKGIARHDVNLGDVRVYNIPTNIIQLGTSATNDSSIFVIQTGGLCIAHLGHMRHAIDDERVARMGHIDVLLMPVDRRVTQSMEELLYNLSKIEPRVIIPMHYFSLAMANDFADSLAHLYPVKKLDTSKLNLTRADMPQETEIWLMRPTAGFFMGGDQF